MRTQKQYTKAVFNAIREINKSCSFVYGHISIKSIKSKKFKDNMSEVCKKYSVKENNIRAILGI
jgi:hypothetical protein